MNEQDQPDRRKFLQTLAGLTTGMMVPFSCQSQANETGQSATAQLASFEEPASLAPQRDRLGDLLPQRKLGKTGETVTMLGLGGAHIARMSESEAQKTIETALAGGVRFFDNAEQYGNGLAEERYGMFLSPEYRDVSYIMTKTRATNAKVAQQHLEDSLRRMKTDYIDLWQIHSVTSPSDVDRRIENRVLEFVQKAQSEGKIRHYGFTGHRDYQAHQRMLEQAADVMQTCQMPINVFDPNYKSFINNVLPKLLENNIAPLAMKTLANGGFFGGTTHFKSGDKPRIVPGALSVQEALHFVWSLPVSVLITGPDHAEMLQEKIDLANSFKSISEEDRQALVARVADFDGGQIEYYKA
ncbi:aldo/keto reductase [Tunicatimonas pelagia]|uniref:aldo/keto reductase n=1 Tax=Tunicatimonas pelagia TaxID=931531 RepID=UPI00266572D1|nr:aldo/keto reductase [Tunicatimonas pelagia]WKN43576.1 aldo/keto reductase [Tunicatimonas pelagia]